MKAYSVSETENKDYSITKRNTRTMINLCQGAKDKIKKIVFGRLYKKFTLSSRWSSTLQGGHIIQ